MADTVVTLSSDDKALMASLKRITAQQDKVDEGLKKVKKTAKDTAPGYDNIVGSVKNWAAGLATVSTAVSLVNAGLDEQVQRADRVLESFREIAAAQQEAAKNLAGATPQQISDILQKEVPRIAIEAGFSDLPALTKALGSVASIVGSETAPSVVATAAKVEALTPDNLQTSATATADLVKATGLKDAREAMSLLLSAGSVARPEELTKLALGSTRAVNAGVLAAPEQDRIAAAKEATALFAALSTVDKSGESASTATVQLISQLRELFAGRESDPGTTMGRLQAIQSDAELRSTLLGDLKGEAIFKPLFEALTDATSKQSQELSNALRTITTDVSIFDEAMKTLDVTPQQKMARSLAAVETIVAVDRSKDNAAATIAGMADITNKAKQATAVGLLDSIDNVMSRWGGGLARSGASPEFFGEQQIQELQMRRQSLEQLRASDDRDSKLQVIDTAITEIQKLRDQSLTRLREENAARAVQEQTVKVDQQTKVLEEIRDGLKNKATKDDVRPSPAKDKQRAQAERTAE